MIRILTFPFFALREKACFMHGFKTPKEKEIFATYMGFSEGVFFNRYKGEFCSLGHHPFQQLHHINSMEGLTLRTTIRNRNDAGFIAWMEGFVLKNQDNPYVPKVHGYARLNTGKTICIMEAFSVLTYTDEMKQQFMALTIPVVLAHASEMSMAVEDHKHPEALLEALTFLTKTAKNKKLPVFLGLKSCLMSKREFVILDPLGE
ncbi:MAG: hypothetical protein OSB62_02440 [Alphaproteobacteria bacterium]|nr:hypothetical protein [Alphaproteobacteria bacterium]